MGIPSSAVISAVDIRRIAPRLAFAIESFFHSKTPMTSTTTQQPTTQARPPARSQRHTEYKVVIYQEGMLSSMLLGAAKVNPLKFGDFLNRNARDGWRVVTMEKDIRRALLFFKREAYVVIMERAA